MDTKFYVSYDAAQALKNIGYQQESEEDALYYVDCFGGTLYNSEEFKKSKLSSDYKSIVAPTYPEVIDWLQEKGIYTECRLYTDYDEEGEQILFYVNIYSEGETYETASYNTREQAWDAAILCITDYVWNK